MQQAKATWRGAPIMADEPILYEDISLIELERNAVNADTIQSTYKSGYTTITVTSIFGQQKLSELLYRAAMNKINSSKFSYAV